jgi:hypothetical protein
MLVRYWFHVKHGLGYGVTAYSNEDARSLLATHWLPSADAEIVSVTENVDVRTLDQGHVVPSMGSPNTRGVWFPCRNV